VIQLFHWYPPQVVDSRPFIRGASWPVVWASISFHRQTEIVRGSAQFHKMCVAASPAFPPIRKLFFRRGDKIIPFRSDKRPLALCLCPVDSVSGGNNHNTLSTNRSLLRTSTEGITGVTGMPHLEREREHTVNTCWGQGVLIRNEYHHTHTLVG